MCAGASAHYSSSFTPWGLTRVQLTSISELFLWRVWGKCCLPGERGCVRGEGATKSHPWGGWGGGRKHRDLETAPGFLRCSVQRWETGYLGRGKLDLGLEGGGQTTAGVSGSLGSSGLGPGTSAAGYSDLHPILPRPLPRPGVTLEGSCTAGGLLQLQRVLWP